MQDVTVCIPKDLKSQFNGLYVNGLFEWKGGRIVNIRAREEWSMVDIFQFINGQKREEKKLNELTKN